MVEQAEARLKLIAVRMKDEKRQQEMEAGRKVNALNEFRALAPTLWPRLDVEVLVVEFGKILTRARVKGEKEYCLRVLEDFKNFPSIHLQAQLGLVG
jgi:hypothetical protein